MMDRRLPCVVTLTLLLVATAVTVNAQPSKKAATIGILTLTTDDPTVGVFRQGLRELGYVEGQNLVIAHRFAAGQVERLPALAAELVHLPVDIIVARATPAVQAAQHATQTIPIVMSAADPVGAGFVASLARPGGNITGTSAMGPELAGKRLEVLRALLPQLSRVAFLAHGGDPAHRLFLQEAQAAGESIVVQVQPLVVQGPGEFAGAFAAMAREGAEALIVQPLFSTNLGQGQQIAALATQHRLPTISDLREFAAAGGLLSYGPDTLDLWRRRLPVYVDKILKGAMPAELPVEQLTKFALVINLQTAEALGITIPPLLLFQADEVIK
jgi:putative tryptophan/tyrosine transport system substrate-binding protein